MKPIKTKVRYQEQPICNLAFRHAYIQILSEEGRYTKSLEVVATISFQQTRGEQRWYGMYMEVKSNKPEHFKYAAKVLAYIKANKNYELHEDPDEVMEIIGAEKHFFCDKVGTFIPESWAGRQIYAVVRGDSTYKRFVAASLKEAEKIMRDVIKYYDEEAKAKFKMLTNGTVPNPTIY